MTFCAIPSPAPRDPLPLAAQWLNEAMAAQVQRNPNSMTLATATAAGQPSARVVLIKDFDATQGYLVFYSHYRSRKGQELASNPYGAGVVHWDNVGRQLRFEGRVVQSPAAESDAYFQNRPWLSQLNAWASDQSEPIADQAAMLAQARQRAARLGFEVGDDLAPADATSSMPRPEHWGGYRLWLSAVEFWVHGDGRFHERLRYERALSEDHQPQVPNWSVTRLQP